MKTYGYVQCGYCKDCKYRVVQKHMEPIAFCESEKIDENWSQDDASDMLLHQYTEGGSFIVGDFFGCVHFKKKED